MSAFLQIVTMLQLLSYCSSVNQYRGRGEIYPEKTKPLLKESSGHVQQMMVDMLDPPSVFISPAKKKGPGPGVFKGLSSFKSWTS